MNGVYDRIRQLRIANGLTQDELALAVGYTDKQGEGQKRRIIPSDNAAADVHEMSGPDKNVRYTRTKMSARILQE